MASGDPLFLRVCGELRAIDPTDDFAHHGLRYCRQAMEALERGERHTARSLLFEAQVARESTDAKVGGRPMTAAERAELDGLRASCPD